MLITRTDRIYASGIACLVRGVHRPYQWTAIERAAGRAYDLPKNDALALAERFKLIAVVIPGAECLHVVAVGGECKVNDVEAVRLGLADVFNDIRGTVARADRFARDWNSHGGTPAKIGSVSA